MGNKNLRISIVIPTHNSEKTIEKCIKSITNSIYSNFELIIIDDFSTDNTKNLISEINCKKVFNQKKLGSAFSRNIGAKLAKGDIIVFIDSDVRINKGALSNLIKLFSSNKNLASVSGIYCDSRYKNILSEYQNMYEIYIQQAFSKLRNLPYINTSFFAIKKTVFKELGGFDTRFKFANQEDIDFGKRLYNLGYKNIFSDKIRIKHLKEFSFLAFLKKKYYQGHEFIKVYFKQKNNLKMNHLVLSHTRNNVTLVLFLIFICILSFFYPTFLYLLLLWFVLFCFVNSCFINFIKNKKFFHIVAYNLFIILQSFMILLGLACGLINHVLSQKQVQ